jgi:hypothetical protein
VSAPPAPWRKRAPTSSPLALGHGAQERGSGEDGQPGQEDAALADQVAQAAGEQEQAPERDQVGIHDPGQITLREAQVVLDRRQRDVHDRRVQDDHEHAHAEHVQGKPTVSVLRLFHATTVGTSPPPHIGELPEPAP